MLAIKYLLMVAGVLLLAAGAAIAIYDAWRVFQHSRWLAKGTGEDVAPELIESDSAAGAVAYIGGAWGGGLSAAADCDEHRGGAERHGRRVHQRYARDAAGDAVLGRALYRSAGRACADVRSARPDLYYADAGRGEARLLPRRASAPVTEEHDGAVEGGVDALGWRLRCGIVSIRGGWIMCSRICRSRLRRSWCRRLWIARGVS